MPWRDVLQGFTVSSDTSGQGGDAKCDHQLLQAIPVSAPSHSDAAIADPAAFSGVVVKTANIIGTNVINRLNEDVGNVEDIVINVLTGCIVYAVLSFGGFLGLGEKLYAVPWKALRYDREMKVYVLNVNRDQIELAPSFDKETWPQFTDDWNRVVHQFYESLPTWAV